MKRPKMALALCLMVFLLAVLWAPVGEPSRNLTVRGLASIPIVRLAGHRQMLSFGSRCVDCHQMGFVGVTRPPVSVKRIQKSIMDSIKPAKP